MTHPNSLKNLTLGNPAWTKGMKSPNPGGRPRIDPILRKKIQAMSPDLFERLRVLAMSADTDGASINAIKLLLAYAWGSPDAAATDDDAERPEQAELTIEEKRAMARRLLAEEMAAETDDDAESDEAEH